MIEWLAATSEVGVICVHCDENSLYVVGITNQYIAPELQSRKPTYDIFIQAEGGRLLLPRVAYE